MENNKTARLWMRTRLYSDDTYMQSCRDGPMHRSHRLVTYKAHSLMQICEPVSSFAHRILSTLSGNEQRHFCLAIRTRLDQRAELSLQISNAVHIHTRPMCPESHIRYVQTQLERQQPKQSIEFQMAIICDTRAHGLHSTSGLSL